MLPSVLAPQRSEPKKNTTPTGVPIAAVAVAATTTTTTSLMLQPPPVVSSPALATTATNTNTKIKKHEVRYLPIASMPTKHSSSSGTGVSHVIQNGALPSISFTTANASVISGGQTGLIQLLPTTQTVIGNANNAKPLLPALAIITPTATLLPTTNMSNGYSNGLPAAPVLIRANQTAMTLQSAAVVSNKSQAGPSASTPSPGLPQRAPTAGKMTKAMPAPALATLSNGSNNNNNNNNSSSTPKAASVPLTGQTSSAGVTNSSSSTVIGAATNSAKARPARVSANTVLSKDTIEQLVKYGQVNVQAVVNTNIKVAESVSDVGAGVVGQRLGPAPPLAKIGQALIGTQQKQQQPKQHAIQQQETQKQSQRQILIGKINQQKLQQKDTSKTQAKPQQQQSRPMKNANIPTVLQGGAIPIPVAVLDRDNKVKTVQMSTEKDLYIHTSKMQQNAQKTTTTTTKIKGSVKPPPDNGIAGQATILTATVNKTPNGQPSQDKRPKAIESDKKKLLDDVKQEPKRTEHRSKSLSNGNLQASNAERRHSVAVVSKVREKVIKHKRQTVIETITINDDDDDELTDVAACASKSASLAQCQLDDNATTANNVQAKSEMNLIDLIEDEYLKCSSSSSPNPPSLNAESVNKQEIASTSNVSRSNDLNIVKAESLPLSKNDFEKSLLCDEEIRNLSTGDSPNNSRSSGSSASTNRITLAPFARIGNDLTINAISDASAESSSSSEVANTSRSLLMAPGALKKWTAALQDADGNGEALQDNSDNAGSYTDMLTMLSTFNMLSWRERVGYASDSKLRFELNEFNLLQLRERCEKRQGPSSHFERPLFERSARHSDSNVDPLLYLCKRCNCHGPASEFLAPKFCSLACLRRNGIKRKSGASLPGERVDRKHRRITPNPASLVKKPFRWSEYISDKFIGMAAPIHLFFNPFPIGPNCFERGMKLEVIDPENCSLFCVCTIVDVRGYRLKLNFDGYPSMYDFWVNADSMDIFPPGWCRSTQRILQPPKGFEYSRFSWERYLTKTKSRAVPCQFFTHLNATNTTYTNPFKIGMHLEAEDLNDTGKICVATVADILDERIRVHFDGWDDCYDFWVHTSSPYIHPCGWHEGRQQLIVPPDYTHSVFKWPKYIKEVGGIAAHPGFFEAREPMDFKADMKLEVVDQRNPCLIRPATVVTRKGYRVQLHLDCWPPEYFFWLEDDSPDLHPIGWCEATVHELEAPPGFQSRPAQMPCDVEGCRGFGNSKRFHLNVHALRDCCPYAPENWRTKIVKPARVAPKDIIRDIGGAILEAVSRPITPAPPATIATNQKSTITHKTLSTEGDIKPIIKSLKEPPTLKTHARERKQSLVILETPKIEIEPIDHVAVSLSPTPLPDAAINETCREISKLLVADYGSRFARNYQLWQENSNFNMDIVTSNPLYWTRWDVFEFIERVQNSEEVAKSLFDEDIDGRALLMMSQDDMTDHLELKLGPAVKLFSTVLHLRIAVICKFNTTKTGLNIFDKNMRDKSRSRSVTDDDDELFELRRRRRK